MPSHYKKYLIFSLIIVILIGFIVFQRKTISKLQHTVDDFSKSKPIDNGVVRSGSKEVPPGEVVDSGSAAGLPMGPIKDDADRNGNSITGINTSSSTSDGTKEDELPSSRTKPRNGNPSNSHNGGEKPNTESPGPVDCSKLVKCPENPDKFDYLNRQQFISLHESFKDNKILLGEVGFSAWKPNPWSVEIYPRVYESSIVIAESPEGKKSAYSKFSIFVNGKSHEIPIEKSQLIFSETPSSFAWNPRLMAGLSMGASIPLDFTVSPSIGLSIGSYGQFLKSPDWFFGVISVGYEINQKTLAFSLDPVLYRISNVIPFTNNLYLGPTVGIDLEGRFLLSGSLKVAF